MESERFDRIARTLATGSRRRLLGALAAGALTTLLPRRAGAACQDGTVVPFPCGVRECVDGEFVDTFDEGTECRPAAGECDAPEFCTGSSLNCPPDRKLPNGTPCGDDGDACTDDVCRNGQCVHVPNAAACADDGNACTADVCANGTCTHPALADGTACPGGACCGGRCVDLKTDAANCGACGRVCGAGRGCCAGRCVRLARDERNCGACGRRCRNGKRCRDGQCR